MQKQKTMEMRVVVVAMLLCIGVCVCAPHKLQDGVEPYKEKWIYQYIDHFNYLGQAGKNGLYKQRYLVSDKHWKGNLCYNHGSVSEFYGFMIPY